MWCGTISQDNILVKRAIIKKSEMMCFSTGPGLYMCSLVKGHRFNHVYSPPSAHGKVIKEWK